MSALLRGEIIIFSLLFLGIVIKYINKKNLLLKYSLMWIGIALFLVVLAFIPSEGLYSITAFLGIETPSNLVFLLVNAGLLTMNFMFTIVISKQDEKIKNLIQKVSIDKYDQKK